MKFRFFLALPLLFLLTFKSHAQWVDGQNASMVLGAPDFITPGSGIYLPKQIVVSPLNKKFVVTNDGTIYRFPANATQQDAYESSFESFDGNEFGSSLSIFIDNSDNLWVADQNKHRVLCFSNASTTSLLNNPILILGQISISESTGGGASNKMNNPTAVYLDGSTLWVADAGNKRILCFKNALIGGNGASAALNLGSANLNAPSQYSFSNPLSIYVDKYGALWVADAGYNRVLRFSNAKDLVNNANADLVLGQEDFYTNISNHPVSSKHFNSPSAIYGDNGNRIYVTDQGNNRILVFQNSQALTNEAAASYVIGQLDFTTNTSGLSQSKLLNPSGIFVDDYLWVTDLLNNRILRFTPNTTLPVELASLTAIKQANGEIQLNWTTSSESNNSHFEVYASSDGKAFTKVTEIKSKGNNGTSLVPLNYDYTLPLSHTALAGLSLLSLLLIPTFKSRLAKLALLFLVVASVGAACTKDKTTQDIVQAKYIKLIQVDLDGKTTDLGIKVIK